MKLKGKTYRTVVRLAMVYGAEKRATMKGQEDRLEENDMRMLRRMCLASQNRNEYVRGSAKWHQWRIRSQRTHVNSRGEGHTLRISYAPIRETDGEEDRKPGGKTRVKEVWKLCG